MIQRASIFWAAVAGLFLTALTMVSSEVRLRDHRLAEIHAAIEQERESIHVLKAERAYLASAERIGRRAGHDLGMKEFDAGRIVAIADLPVYIPTPDFELEPNTSQPLLLSGFIMGSDIGVDMIGGTFGQNSVREENVAGGFITASFLPPPRLETAVSLHETAWVLTQYGAASE